MKEEKTVVVVKEMSPTKGQLLSQHWSSWKGNLEGRTPPIEENLLGKSKFIKRREPKLRQLLRGFPDQKNSHL